MIAGQRGEPQPRVLAQHPQLGPDVRQVHGAGFVDTERQRRLDALVLAQRAGKDVDRLLALLDVAFLLRLEHAAGEGHRQAVDLAGPRRVLGAAAVADRVDVGVRLAQHLVDGGRHQAAGRMNRLDGHHLREQVLRRIVFLDQEVAVVFVDELQQRPVQLGGELVGAVPVVRIGHVPERAFQPAVVVRPQVALRAN